MPWIAFQRRLHTPEKGLEGMAVEHAILEGPVKTDWKPYEPGSVNWADYERGVLFGDHAEVRFRRRTDGLFHLVLLTDLEPEEVPQKENWEGWKRAETMAQDSRVILWGEPDAAAGGWFEGRIPARLPYPFPEDPEVRRMAVRVRRYRLSEEDLELHRYVRVEFVKTGRTSE